jgi:hypothetical protein
MNLNRLGLIELVQDWVKIVKIECEVTAFPRTRDYPVGIAVETAGFPNCGKIDLSVPRQYITSVKFEQDKTPICEVYAILLNKNDLNSDVVIKTARPPDEDKYCSSFKPRKDKVKFFNLQEELFPPQR